MKSTDKIMDMLCTELDEIAEKGQLSAGDLETVHKLVVTKEKLLRIEELEEGLGYSQAGDWEAKGRYSKGNSYGRHYVRGHYSRGRYSMAEGREMMANSLADMMENDNLSDRERNALRNAYDAMKR